MHYRWFCVPLMVPALLAACLGASGVEPVPPTDSTKKTVTVVTSATSGEVRDYKMDFSVKGKQTGTADVSAAATFKIRHSYSRNRGEELLPMEISLQKGQIITQGQALEITPALYPKLTVLLENPWQINDVLGAAGSRFAEGMPGINYGNHIVLFYLIDGDKPHAVGDSWGTKIRLPSLGQAYDVVNTMKGVETIDGIEGAKVTQQITRAPQGPGIPHSNMKCSIQSWFALKNGKLLKSHAECEVELPPDETVPSPPVGKNQPASKAATPEKTTMKIDIALVKQELTPP